METVQFETKLFSLDEIRIPDEIKQKIQLNQDVRVLLIPAGENLYEDWGKDEWNHLSQVNDSGE